MRIFSILTAIIVTAALYLAVFERDKLLSFAAREPASISDSVVETELVKAESTTSDERVVSVVALKSVAQQVDSAVVLRGRTEAARQVDVRAETSGLINSEPLRKGTTVEAGQMLCEIAVGTRDATLQEAHARLPEAKARLPEAEGRLAEAQARLEEARIDENAAAQLSEDGFASEMRVAATRASVQSALAGVETAKAGVETARAAALTAQAAIRAAEKEIERLWIYAPFGGVLETDTAELGALMQPGSLCATIIQLDPIKLVGFVPETQVGRVAVGATANARTTAGQSAMGEVTFLSRSSDMETRTFRVEVTVPNEKQILRDGQTAEFIIGPDGIWISGLPEEVDVIVTGQEFVTDGVAIDVSYAEVKS